MKFTKEEAWAVKKALSQIEPRRDRIAASASVCEYSDYLYVIDWWEIGIRLINASMEILKGEKPC